MPALSETIASLYGTTKDALEHLRDMLITEEAYTDLFGDEQLAFHEWAFKNAHTYIDSNTVDWVGAFYDWREEI